MGPVYGKLWRSWGCRDGSTIDQLSNAITGITQTIQDGTASVGRRLIVTAWSPEDLPNQALPSCHCFFQFGVSEGRLSCHLYQRSADAFLGIPFNVASYAILTHLVARDTGLEVGDFVHTFGDLHIYTNHLDQVREQLSRTPLPLPHLSINTPQKSLFGYKTADFSLLNYQHHPALKGEVAV